MKWFKTKEVRNRIFYTLIILAIFELGTYITLPYISTVSGGSLNSLGNLLNITTGGSLGRFGFLALGISPYVTASIVVQLLTKGIPQLKRISEKGDTGKRKIAQYTRLVSIVFAFLTAFSFIFNPHLAVTMGVIVEATIKQRFLLCLIMTAGSIFTIWLSEKIDKYGIGQGSSLLIGFGILANIPQQAYSVINDYKNYTNTNNLPYYFQNVAILLGVLTLIVVISIFANNKEYKLPIQSKTNKYPMKAHYFPIKLLASSVMPIIFATAIMTVFNIYATYQNYWWEWTDYSTVQGLIVFSITIFFFSFIYNYIQFDGEEISKNFNESGVYFIGVPNTQTAKHLNKKLFLITLKGAPLLTFLGTVAIGIELLLPFKIALSGISILIIVGVIQEIKHQVNGLIGKHQYKEIF